MDQGAKRPRVLVIRGGAIGDFILTLPAIRLLRDHIPNAHIEILGYQPIIELAIAAGIADSTRSLEHAAMARLFIPEANLDNALREYFRSFNLVISYLFDPDGILRGNMEKIGVKTYLEASHEVTPDGGHAAEQLAKPLERLAMFLDDPAPRIAVAATTHEKKPIIALHPGSGSLKKNWPIENWIALGIELAKTFPEREIALVTGEAEAERGLTAKIIESWRAIRFHHWDQLSLVELASRLATCQSFIGHDSGISHLAAACGLPCLLFFGPTDPAVWAPRGAEVQVIAEPSGDLALLDFDQTRAAVQQFMTSR